MSFGSFTLARSQPSEYLALKTDNSSPEEPSLASHSELTKATGTGSAAAKGRYTFVNTARPRDVNTSDNRKTVRSQAARLNPLEDTGDAGAKAKKRRRATKLTRTRTFRIEFRIKEACARARKSIEAPPTPPPSTVGSHKSTRLLTRSPNGGWSSPFAWQESSSNGCAPFLFSHCEYYYRRSMRLAI